VEARLIRLGRSRVGYISCRVYDRTIPAGAGRAGKLWSLDGLILDNRMNARVQRCRGPILSYFTSVRLADM